MVPENLVVSICLFPYGHFHRNNDGWFFFLLVPYFQTNRYVGFSQNGEVTEIIQNLSLLEGKPTVLRPPTLRAPLMESPNPAVYHDHALFPVSTSLLGVPLFQSYSGRSWPPTCELIFGHASDENSADRIARQLHFQRQP